MPGMDGTGPVWAGRGNRKFNAPAGGTLSDAGIEFACRRVGVCRGDGLTGAGRGWRNQFYAAEFPGRLRECNIGKSDGDGSAEDMAALKKKAEALRIELERLDAGIAGFGRKGK